MKLRKKYEYQTDYLISEIVECLPGDSTGKLRYLEEVLIFAFGELDKMDDKGEFNFSKLNLRLSAEATDELLSLYTDLVKRTGSIMHMDDLFLVDEDTVLFIFNR